MGYFNGHPSGPMDPSNSSLEARIARLESIVGNGGPVRRGKAVIIAQGVQAIRLSGMKLQYTKKKTPTEDDWIDVLEGGECET